MLPVECLDSAGAITVPCLNSGGGRRFDWPLDKADIVFVNNGILVSEGARVLTKKFAYVDFFHLQKNEVDKSFF